MLKLLGTLFIVNLPHLISIRPDTIKYSERPNGHNSPYRIPIKEILESPNVYELTHLQVVGYLNVGFEDICVYSIKDDLEKHRYKKGLWINISRSKFSEIRNYDHHYVVIDAIFDANNHGYGNLWGGALKNITKIQRFGK